MLCRPKKCILRLNRLLNIENILTRSHAESGLGLVLIKKMVILHQGTVRLESEEGQGTKVIICFPESRIIT